MAHHKSLQSFLLFPRYFCPSQREINQPWKGKEMGQDELCTVSKDLAWNISAQFCQKHATTLGQITWQSKNT